MNQDHLARLDAIVCELCELDREIDRLESVDVNAEIKRLEAERDRLLEERDREEEALRRMADDA